MHDIYTLIDIIGKFDDDGMTEKVVDFLCEYHVDTRLDVIEFRNDEVYVPEDPCMVREQIFCNTHLAKLYKSNGINSIVRNQDAYIRWTNNCDEPLLTNNLEIRASINHRTMEHEPGLSVTTGPWHYWQSNTHCYMLSGNKIGRGSDGEPTIDIRTLSIASDLLSRKEALNCFYNLNKIRIRELSESIKTKEVLLFALFIGLIGPAPPPPPE